MKKTLKIAVLLALSALLFALPAAAMGNGNGNVKGEVTAVDDVGGTLTMLSNKGETLTVVVPEGFDFLSVVVGDSILVRGDRDGDVIAASTVKVVDDEEEEAEEVEVEEVESEGEGSLADNSAFCAEGKQDKAHPMATSIAETYGMTEEQVGAYFCEGHSFGAIMLAAQTSGAGGGDVASVLASRAAGQGWGQIWKGLDLVGKDREKGGGPPAHSNSNRPEHAGSGKPEHAGSGKPDSSESSE